MCTEEGFENSAIEQELVEKVTDEFSDLFDDMLFKKGTATYDMIGAKVGELENFAYESYQFKVEGRDGYFDPEEKTLCVSRELDDAAILHEMIHLHESVLPLFYHDIVFWSLYKDLKVQIPQLDEIITSHANVLNEEHDILFLLKSFDLDIAMDYPLGTVFGSDIFNKYEYTEDLVTIEVPSREEIEAAIEALPPDKRREFEEGQKEYKRLTEMDDPDHETIAALIKAGDELLGLKK